MRAQVDAADLLGGAMPTCALDVVDAAPGGLTLDAVAGLLGLTKERVRQIQEHALRQVRRLWRAEEKMPRRKR